MNVFSVTREAGPSWTEGKGAFDQPDVGDHVAFMNVLEGEGLVLVAGPLAGNRRRPHPGSPDRGQRRPKPTSAAVWPTTRGNARNDW